MEIKNPFSLYDFLGYFFPGAMALFIIYAICMTNTEYGTIIPFDYIAHFYDFLTNGKKVDLVKVLLPFIIVSYVLGHLFAYLSSVTVEYFTNRVYMYPSRYLLEDTSRGTLWSRYWTMDTEHPKFKYILLSVIFVLLLPVDVIVFLSKLVRTFVTRKLDDMLVVNIKKKIRNLSSEINMDGEVSDNDDYHRVVMHYVYLNLPPSNRKTENYIALYGFLRSTTLILVLFTDWLIIISLHSIYANFGSTGCEFSLSSFILVLSMWLVSFVSYMGFVKFYRRFTQENFMSLLTGKWHLGGRFFRRVRLKNREIYQTTVMLLSGIIRENVNL